MNNSINNNYNIELEVLSPLHVGAGSEKDWVKGLDFIQDKDKLIKLNTRKMYEVLSNDISKLSNYLAQKDERGLKSLIAGRISQIKEQEFDFNETSSNDIKAFIKTGLENKPYIPGSSLKGAIRSILLNYFLNGDKPTYNGFEKDYFGSSTAGDEFMRFVKISDVQFEKTELVNTKIFNLYKDGNDWKGGWKHGGGKFGKTTSKFSPSGFNTIYEIIHSSEKSKIFTISLSEKQLDNFNKNNTKKISNTKKEILQEQNKIPKKLFEIINSYTKEYIKREINFFTKYSNNKTENIIDNLEEIKNSIPDDNSTCVLRMSAGSGFHSVTGDWQLNEHTINGVKEFKNKNGFVYKRQGTYNKDLSAKSRKIAISNGNFMPMGFVKLKILSDEEIKQKEKKEAEQRKIELQKAEQKRIEREKQEKLKQQFDNLITEADNLFAEKQYQKAIEKYKEAQEIDKEADLTMYFQKCQNAIEKQKEEQEQDRKRIENDEFLKQKKEEELKRQEENKRKKEQERKKLLEEGLTIPDDLRDFNKGKKIIEDFYKAKNEQQIEGANLQTLKNFIENCIKKTNKRWKKAGDKDWKLVEKWVGKETAQQWFNEFIK